MGNLLPGQREQIVNIHWDEEHQTIQDFGTFAGRSTQLYSSPKRDEILELLFGESGLQLTLIRSTIFPDLNFDYDDPGKSMVNVKMKSMTPLFSIFKATLLNIKLNYGFLKQPKNDSKSRNLWPVPGAHRTIGSKTATKEEERTNSQEITIHHLLHI